MPGTPSHVENERYQSAKPAGCAIVVEGEQRRRDRVGPEQCVVQLLGRRPDRIRLALEIGQLADHPPDRGDVVRVWRRECSGAAREGPRRDSTTVPRRPRTLTP